MAKRKHRTALLDPPPSGPVRQGLVSPRRTVPAGIPRPEYALTGWPTERGSRAIRTADEIQRMRVSGRMAAEVLVEAGRAVEPGITTDEIDRIVHEATIERGAYPSPLNYKGFPKSVCTSANEVICHGIPDSRKLQDGDILNIDVTCFYDGVHGDTNATFLVGEVDEASRALVSATREAMHAGIDVIRPGTRINEIGRAIEQSVRPHQYGVVREFIGHGIGDEFHTSLQIPHYFEPRHRMKLEEGMTFTVEPMITIGAPELYVWDDDWTAVTISGQRCAQFEHTLLVTAEGVEILTVPADGPPAELLFAEVTS
ncbi:MAG TPA: type I methionyl aminopeptidase [Microthrixaceae bacterium]|nr:type I methionyl aminopeptidase [Microthrixaceae bacterium]